MRKKKKEGSSLFPGVGKQLIAFRYFEMKLLPWECFHISPLIMMGRNNEQYSSQNSRNKGNKERKMKLGRTGSQERIDEFSQNSALGAFEENLGRGVRRSALFLPGSQFPYRLEGGNLEVGGGDSSVLLVRGLSCSFLLGLCSGGGAGSGERK